MNNIWTITTIGLHKDKSRYVPRTWGYYFTREEAIRGMHSSVDSEAGYYTHAIIERFDPGIYAMAEDEEWFESVENRWVPCAKPTSETYIVNYGMG